MLLLALALFALTLVVPLMVWAQSTSWRLALHAWKRYAAFMALMYALGLLVWAGTIVFI
jgi:hypothetical protein